LSFVKIKITAKQHRVLLHESCFCR